MTRTHAHQYILVLCHLLKVVGEPTFEQWEDCGRFIRKCEGAVHFWIGDWLNYGEKKWGEMYTQAMEHTGFEYQTLADDKYISSRIEFSDRSENMGIAHAKQLAPLSKEEQRLWAEEIKKEAIPVRELKEKIKQRKKDLLPTPIIPKGKFSVIYADPPWQYYEGGYKNQSQHYPTMTIDKSVLNLCIFLCILLVCNYFTFRSANISLLVHFCFI